MISEVNIPEMKTGEMFDSYADFMQKLEKRKQHKFEEFNISKSSKKHKGKDEVSLCKIWFPLLMRIQAEQRLVYADLDLECIHFGDPDTRGSFGSIRTNQASLKTGCSVVLKLKVSNT